MSDVTTWEAVNLAPEITGLGRWWQVAPGWRRWLIFGLRVLLPLLIVIGYVVLFIAAGRAFRS